MARPERQPAGTAAGATGDLAWFAARVAMVILLVGLALAAWYLATVLIAVFGGILFAVVLRRLGAALAARTPLNVTWSVGLLVLTIAALVAGGLWSFGNQLGSQFQELSATLADSMQSINAWMERNDVDVGAGDVSESMMSWAASIGNVLWQMGSGTLLVLFVMLYLGFAPGVYRYGLMQLFPRRLEGRVDEVLDALGEALWRWTLGQFISMVVIGVLTTLALWLLGVPLALMLGLIAGVLEFVPILGPIIATIPAVMVAMTVSGTTALWVLLAYVVIQQLESWIVSPLAQRSAVALPPAVTLVAVAAFGLLFGLPGLLFATPLAVVIIVVVRMKFVRDVLHEPLSDSRLPP